MNLNNIEQITKLDKNELAKSISLIPAQIKQILEDTREIKIPAEYKNIDQIVISGMGGSNLGPKIIKSVYSNEIKVPFSINADYQIPDSVTKHTLFILSSYSGNTEEVLHTYKEAKKRKAKIMIVTAGGKLAEIIKKDNLPGYVFEDINNPSGQPRIGIGYSIACLLVLLSKAGVLKINKEGLKKTTDELEKESKKLKVGVNIQNNPAKKIAEQTHGKQVVLVGAEFLEGNIEAMRNQFCENGKNFASYLILPNLNHFAMEGLADPSDNKEDIIFLFIDSDLYYDRIQKRGDLTKRVVKKNKIEVLSYKLKNKTKLEQALELLQLGTWVTYYSGLLNERNPGTIYFVDWFKKQLK